MWLDRKIVRPSCLGLADDLVEGLLDERIETGRRLVEDQQVGAVLEAAISPIFCLLPFEYSLNLRVGSTSRRGDQLGLVDRIDPAAEVREVFDRLAAGQLVVEG